MTLGPRLLTFALGLAVATSGRAFAEDKPGAEPARQSYLLMSWDEARNLAKERLSNGQWDNLADLLKDRPSLTSWFIDRIMNKSILPPDEFLRKIRPNLFLIDQRRLFEVIANSQAPAEQKRAASAAMLSDCTLPTAITWLGKNPDFRFAMEEFAAILGRTSGAKIDEFAASFYASPLAEPYASTLYLAVRKMSARNRESVAKTLIPLPRYWSDWNSMVSLLYFADNDSRVNSRLVRYRLSHPTSADLASPYFHLIMNAARIAEKSRRQDYLRDAIKMVSESNDQVIRDFVAKNRSTSAPAGYSMVKEYLGSGKTSIVHLVKRESDGLLFAWKIPTNDEPDLIADLSTEVERTKAWRKFGLTTMYGYVSEDGKTLFKSYIEGQTVRKLIQSGALFDRQGLPFAAMKRFIEKLLRHLVEVGGLNAENLILSASSGEFEIIDGSSPTKRYLRSALFSDLRESFIAKWSRASMGLEDKKPLLTTLFVDLRSELEAVLNQPPLVSDLGKKKWRLNPLIFSGCAELLRFEPVEDKNE